MRTRTVCGVSHGDPPLSLRWLKDGEPLPSSLGANISSLDQYSSLLSIPSLSASHSGDYTCVANNPAAEVKYTATLQVKGKVGKFSSFFIFFFYNVIVFHFYFLSVTFNISFYIIISFIFHSCVIFNIKLICKMYKKKKRKIIN